MAPDTQMNPVVIVGAAIIVVTGVMSVLVDVEFGILALQAAVPMLIGVGLVSYGRLRSDGVAATSQRTVLKWTVTGFLAFVILGAWFGEMASRADSSILLSMTGSLSVGAALGTVIGVYAARLRRTNEELAETVSELERANERLTMRNEQLDQFVDVASHDLRNPVNVAKGRIELARRESDSEHLETADAALTRMEALITDLVSLTKAGDRIDEVAPANLEAVSRSAWGSVDTGDASLRVETEIAIFADESRLRQILENLFRNSVEHGGEDVTVRVGAIPNGFYVEDTGAGIRDDLRDRLFEDGVTTGEGGAGLGLTIVKQIATAHGWEIDVEQSAEGGARFAFTGVEFPDG
ncbi:HAMP domain-containing sensor histidine kinase [Halorubrum ezzemoulense]|uniref:sensor histidine kinase n=1 Tax=Halorubrum ezzemoulense TaxID=337243 RepID=UPI002330BC2F|nr:HAMP domain-containing sensor histidine kinase [Halorubrum ezzemoulense]MDB2273333.1 HAMP domain-containing sensor histidine kinase [Halorubrum ezzemoulense]